MPRLLISKTSAFGDIAQTFYVLQDIARARPDLEIICCVDERFKELIELHPAVAKVVSLPTRRWRNGAFKLSSWLELVRWITKLRNLKIDIALDLQGMYKSGFVCWVSGAPVRIGRARGNFVEGVSHLFCNKKYEFPRSSRLAEVPRRFTGQALGYDPTALTMVSGLHGWRSGEHVGIILGASKSEKTWPLENWKKLITKISENSKLIPVLDWGTEAERLAALEVAKSVEGVELHKERKGPQELVKFFNNCRFILGVDTGPTHLAVASGAPVVMLFGLTSPQEYSHPALENLSTIGSTHGWPTVDEVFNFLRNRNFI